MIEVVVAVIKNRLGQFLLTDRSSKHVLSDCWEFPGGKVKLSETLPETLSRELKEELAIKISKPQKLISTFIEYPEGQFNIHAYLVTNWQGKIKNNEAQKLIWLKNLNQKIKVLPPTKSILNALNLSERYLITPAGKSLKYLVNLLSRHQNLIVQYRAPDLETKQYIENANKLILIAKQNQHKILLNSNATTAKDLNADGVHWNSKTLLTQTKKPDNLLVSASCHNQQQIIEANKLPVDMVLLAPVQKTKSHPQLTQFLTWQGFENLCDFCNMPAFALGGVELTDIKRAKDLGGQGIAGISTFENYE